MSKQINLVKEVIEYVKDIQMREFCSAEEEQKMYSYFKNNKVKLIQAGVEIDDFNFTPNIELEDDKISKIEVFNP